MSTMPGEDAPPSITWVVLTMGDRPDALADAVRSVRQHAAPTSRLLVVSNGGPAAFDGVAPDETLVLPGNVGVPGGRDAGARLVTTELIGFLDDDAVLTADAERRAVAAFTDPAVAAVALRIVDERGETARRHVPRPGAGGAERGGPVVNFLGGACIVRRAPYVEVGGYWSDLWYGHEELDLAWRLIDAGMSVMYVPAAVVRHPRTEIGRHPEGWYRTGRNRVLIARRNLPVPVLVAHTVVWLALGALRAPGGARRGYVRGWWSGWSGWLARRPMSWATVWRLTRLGRPPVV